MVYKLCLCLNIIENSKAINTTAVNTKFYTFTYKKVYWQVFEFNWLSCLGFRIVYYYISTYVCVSPFLKVRHSCSSHMFVTHVRHTCSSHKFITHFSVAKATLHSQMSIRSFVRHKIPQQLEIIILHHSSFNILHSSFRILTFNLFSLL